MVQDAVRAFEAGEELIAIRDRFQINGREIHNGDRVRLGLGASSFTLIQGRFFVSQATAEYSRQSEKGRLLRSDWINPAKQAYDDAKAANDGAVRHLYDLQIELERASNEIKRTSQLRQAAEMRLEDVLDGAEKQLDSDAPYAPPVAPTPEMQAELAAAPASFQAAAEAMQKMGETKVIEIGIPPK